MGTKMGSGGKNECNSCITRVSTFDTCPASTSYFFLILLLSLNQVPYATLIALIMCWAGVGVFCGTLYRGVNLTLRLLQDVFKLDRGLDWWVGWKNFLDLVKSSRNESVPGVCMVAAPLLIPVARSNQCDPAPCNNTHS